MVNKEKDKVVFDRLNLAKQIYYHGVQHSSEIGPLNKMIAIHNYHNSIEITLRNILLKYEIRTEKTLNLEFEVLINEIDNASLFKSKKIKIHNRQDLRDLNQLRNWVQHKAIEPETSTMDYWKIFTKQALVFLYKEYFNADFERISSVDFIEDIRLQKILSTAEENLKVKDNITCLNYSRLAFEYGVSGLDLFLPTKKFSPFFDGLSRTLTTRSGLEKPIETAINNTNSRINEVQHFTVVISSGVDLLDYKRFVDLSPEITYENGFPQFANKKCSDEEAIWFFHFVVNTLIKWEYQGLNPKVSNWAIDECDKFLQKI